MFRPNASGGANVDSCFLCVMKHAALPTQINQPGSEGYGTCSNCRAHACQIHGDIVAGQTYFMCADCLARAKLITAVTAPPPPPPNNPAQPAAPNPPVDPVLQRAFVDAQNAWLFRGIAPNLTPGTAPLVPTVDVERLSVALGDLTTRLRDTGSLLRQAISDWESSEANSRRRALGFSEVDEYTEDEQFADDMTGREVIGLAAYALQRDAQAWSLRSSDDLISQVELASWSLATVYSARGADTVDISPLMLPGGLRMPPITLFLAEIYQNRTDQ